MGLFSDKANGFCQMSQVPVCANGLIRRAGRDGLPVPPNFRTLQLQAKSPCNRSRLSYAATFEFLGELYDTVHNDTLGALLESMRLRPDTGMPVNPGMKELWLETVQIHGEPQLLTPEDAYAVMTEFVRELGLQIPPPGLQNVISWLSLHEHDAEMWQTWQDTIVKAVAKYKDWDREME
jgi:hypothetical protein